MREVRWSGLLWVNDVAECFRVTETKQKDTERLREMVDILHGGEWSWLSDPLRNLAWRVILYESMCLRLRKHVNDSPQFMLLP